MDIKEFARQIKEKKKELDILFQKKMPVHAGRIAKEHYQDNFRKSGYVNGGLKPWQKAKRLSSGSRSADANYGTLLSSRNNLFSSIRYVPSDGRVTVSNTAPYASAHNWGETVHPTVTPRMRKFAWAKYFEAGGRKKGDPKDKEETAEAKKWKGLALTKKTKLTLKMPQRQFLGESQELNEKISDKSEIEVLKILNS